MTTKLIFVSLGLILFCSTNAQNVGIGTTNPLERLSVGASSQFRIDANGNIVRINNVAYSFPAAQGTNQYLKNDGAGNLSWTPAPRPVIRVFTVVNNGMSDWMIDSPSDYISNSNLDPTLTLQRGFTYQFVINASGHPFRITDQSNHTGVFNIGVTNNSIDVGTITFTVPMDAPAQLFYYCMVHPGTMNGTINIQ
jgi:hypothetical protein